MFLYSSKTHTFYSTHFAKSNQFFIRNFRALNYQVANFRLNVWIKFGKVVAKKIRITLQISDEKPE